MTSFIGACGGCLMILLIAVLLIRFLAEMRLIHDEKTILHRILRYIGPGCAMLLAGGIYAYAQGRTSSITDLSTAFASQVLYGRAVAPWNFYISTAMACVCFLILRASTEKLLDSETADEILDLLSLFPGVFLALLPGHFCVILSVMTLCIWLASRFTSVRMCGCPKLPESFSAIINCAFTILNGLLIVVITRGLAS